MSTKDESLVQEPIKLEPEVYWSQVVRAYEVVRDEDFSLKDFLEQAVEEWNEAEGDVLTESGIERTRGVVLKVPNMDKLLTAVCVSEVLGNRLTYADSQDLNDRLGYAKEGDADFGVREFIEELRLLTSDDRVFARMCLAIAELYIDDAIRRDPVLSEAGKESNIREGSECTLRIISMLDRAEAL